MQRKMRASSKTSDIIKSAISPEEWEYRHTIPKTYTLYTVMGYRSRAIGKVNFGRAQLCSQFAKIWQVVQGTKSSRLIIFGTSFSQDRWERELQRRVENKRERDRGSFESSFSVCGINHSVFVCGKTQLW